MIKRTVLILCLLAGNLIFPPLFYKERLGGVKGSLAMADDAAKAPTTVPDTAHTIVGGVVKTVSWADPVKGTRSEIVVTDTGKKPIHILVTSTTTLWDSDAKAIMPDKIIAKSHINVIYRTTPEGVNIAKSIKIIK